MTLTRKKSRQNLILLVNRTPYRQELKRILSPRGILNKSGEISTGIPDIPGFEPPFFEITSTQVEGIDFGSELTLGYNSLGTTIQKLLNQLV